MKKEFLVERQGKAFALYAGLLDEGHSQGLKRITTKLIQVPSEDNGKTAIVFAEVETERGTFTGIGDAAPENVSRLMVPHLIRMAETRAKARALRDAINVGVVAVEELGDFNEPDDSPSASNVVSHPSGRTVDRDTGEVNPAPRPTNGSAQPQAARPQQAPAPQQQRQAEPAPSNGSGATPAQVRAIYLIARDQHGMSEAQVEEHSMGKYGRLPSELSKSEASALITAFKR